VQPVVLISWNLQGSKGVDTAAVAEAVRSQRADVLLLQEIQRRQADALAKALGWSVQWAEKHSAPFIPAEGLAVLASTIEQSSVLELRGGPRRSWRRRIAVIAEVTIRGRAFVLADVHLSPGEDDQQRDDEIARLLRFLHTEPWEGRPQAVIGGDFNIPPPAAFVDRLQSGGWQDAWASAPTRVGDGSTNWTQGPRQGRPPTQRLDLIFVPSGCTVLEADVPTDHEKWAVLSDHLPLRVVIAAGGAEEPPL
jgi:endonuclease/exonuclease/phosphatase family metal-dependent hydrolase